MSATSPGFLFSLFRFLISKRWWIVAIYALLLPPSIYFALQVPQDNSLDRLMVQSDPDYLASRDFGKVFGTGEYAVVRLDAKDPFAPDVLARVDQIDRALSALPGVDANSALSVFRRAKAGFHDTPEEAEAFRRFATGTDIFRNQGLVAPHTLSIALVLSIHDPAERNKILGELNSVLDPVKANPAPLLGIHTVGQPYVNAYLDNDTRRAGMRYFPLFGLFVIVLNLILYRSFRTLLAFMICLGTSAALTAGFVGITHGTFTMVSQLVPMTILIVCTATLVYIHSRFVDHPAGRSVDDHQVFALCNKFLACTASVFATAVGFAALAVSAIRPIREMGIWVAVGLCFTWVIVFTLFPALQKILRTPTGQKQQVAGAWFERFAGFLPGFSYRFRWVLVPGALFLCVLGAVALFGFPGLLPRMEMQTNPVEYINHNTDLYKDTQRLERETAGLSISEIWLRGKQGSVSQPQVVRGLCHLQEELDRQPQIGTTVGLCTILRSLRYVGGKGDRLPEDDAALEKITDTLEDLLPNEPALRRFVEPVNLAQTHVVIITKTLDYEGFVKLKQQLERTFQAAQERDPALREFSINIVGLAALQAKISFHLVPTLVQSFGLTVVIIFGAFLLVFRNGAARLMAMIPSLFAILVMFGIMRLFGMTLNVATILIASTVLGTSENDQIHFFYHFLEKRKDGTTEESLRHTLTIAGRAIFFATLINAGGFLAFALADLPPIREFGLLSALAFVLSMVADFTALPAALWLVFRDKPDALKTGAAPTPPAPPGLRPDAA